MNYRALAALAMIAVGLWLHSGGKLPLPPSPSPHPNVPTVTYTAPTGELLALTTPLKAHRGKPAAATVAKFYADFGDVLGRDTTQVKTLGQFRAAHQRAQTLMAQRTDMVGALPGLSAQINDVLAKYLGLDDVALERAKVIDACKAIAWGLGGTD